MKENKQLKKLRGYQKAARERFMLLKDGTLTQEEFLLYELCVAITDWDRTHETYGTFQATNQELAELCGWKCDSSAKRYKDSLVTKGFLTFENDRGKPFDFHSWELKKVAEAQIRFAKKQFSSANLHTLVAESNDIQPQGLSQSVVSSKGSISFNSEDEYLSEEELEEISNALDEMETTNSLQQPGLLDD